MPIGEFIVFFLLLVTGLLCKKYGILTDAAVNAINKLVLNVTIPCLILVRTTALDMDGRLFTNFLLAFFINMGCLLLLGAYARLYCRGKRFADDEKPVIELSILASNNGFMGFPVAILFFGDLGLLYMVGANIALNIGVFTYGTALMQRGRDIAGGPSLGRVSGFVRMATDPKVCAAAAGIILCYNHVTMPGIAVDYLDTVGSLATPLAMISIGAMLAGNFGPRSFKTRSIMAPVLNKLFVCPAVSAVIVWFLPIDPLVKMITIVSNALPVATIVAMQAEQYGRNKDIASAAIVISTIFSIATVPAAIWFLHHSGL
ncbi:MAG: AEC family transporter [Clostridiales bacterium]|nr:AEC family transporter [Clostridiales bacterium]